MSKIQKAYLQSIQNDPSVSPAVKMAMANNARRQNTRTARRIAQKEAELNAKLALVDAALGETNEVAEMTITESVIIREIEPKAVKKTKKKKKAATKNK